MTQVDAILAHLKAGNRLTPIEALNRFGCFRLAARISDLRKEGNNVLVENVTRNGKTFAEYRLDEGLPKQISADSFKIQKNLIDEPVEWM